MIKRVKIPRKKYRTTGSSSHYDLKRTSSHSIYQGVTKDKRWDRYLVQITHHRKQLYLGTFTNEREAAHCYNVVVYVLGHSISYPNKNLGLSRGQEVAVEEKLKERLLHYGVADVM